MTQDTKPSEAEVILGKTHFTYPGENELIPYSAEAIATNQRPAEMMRLTGLEMLRRASLMSDSSCQGEDWNIQKQS